MRAVGKLLTTILPWPPRHQRQAAIGDARREKERSRDSASHAAVIQKDIERMASVNHFAESIRASLIQGYRSGGLDDTGSSSHPLLQGR